MTSTYTAFISYSHDADGRLSAAIQSGLHQFAKTWYQTRAIKVFRDKTSMSPNPALWESIEKALAASDYFLLLASPQSAHSPWVRREIEWWLTNRQVERLLILLTSGDLAWQSGASGSDFDWSRTNALPDVLRGVFKQEPLWVDLRWADSPDRQSLRHTQFHAAILDISATVRGVPKDELDGEDVRQHRRTRMLATAMVLGILAFAIVAASQAYVATVQRGIATVQRNTAMSRLLAAQSLKSSTDAIRHLDAGLLQSVAAYRIQPTVEAQHSLMTALLEANRVKAFVHASDTVASLALRPDGRIITTGDTKGSITFWDAETLQPTMNLENGNGFVLALAFSPDGRRLAAVNAEQLSLWNLSGDRVTKERTLDAKDRFTNVVWSPTGRTIYANDAGTRRWDVESGLEQPTLTVEVRQSTRRLAVSPDGSTIATAGDDAAVTLWDAVTGRLRQTLSGRSRTVTALAFNRDGSVLASGGGDGRITVWDVPHGTVRTTLEKYRASVDSIAFSPDGSTLASGDRDRMVILWNLATGEPREILLGHTNGITNIVFARAGSELISIGFENTFIVWNLGLPKQSALLAAHTGSVTNVVASPDGATFASSGADGSIRLWDIATGKERAVLKGHRGEVRAMTFNRVSGVLASGGEDRRVLFWDTATRQVVDEIDAQGEVESLAISPDGKTLTWAASGTSPIFLWDIAAKGEPRKLRGHDTEADSLEFSRSGNLLVSAGGSTIRVWDPRTGREVAEPMEVGTAVRATISPDGQTIASSQTFPNEVLLWPLRGSGKPIELPTGNVNSDHHQVFSPDGRMLAYSAGEAALTIVLAALGDDNARWTLDMPASVEAIAFTRDGKQLLTGHSNGRVGIWDADVRRWLDRACEVANRNLTHAEWNTFVGTEMPYQAVCPALPVPRD